MVETIKGEDAELLRTLAMKVRVTVTGRWMEGLMMVTRGARDLLCVAATTVKSLDLTTMRKMIAVRKLPALAAQRGKTMTMTMTITMNMPL